MMEKIDLTGPNVSRLREKLTEMYDQGLKNFRITPGPEFYNLPIEDRAGTILGILENMDRWNALPTEEKMRFQMVDIYQHVQRAMEAINTENTASAWGELDGALVLLGNWVSKNDEPFR